MKYPPYGLHNTFPFGKYIGEGVGAIIDKDPKYVKWMIENSDMIFDREVVDRIGEIDDIF